MGGRVGFGACSLACSRVPTPAFPSCIKEPFPPPAPHTPPPAGTVVAVKVRHPGVSEAIERDFALMMAAARVAAELPALQALRLEESLKQFAAPLREQVGVSVLAAWCWWLPGGGLEAGAACLHRRLAWAAQPPSCWCWLVCWRPGCPGAWLTCPIPATLHPSCVPAYRWILRVRPPTCMPSTTTSARRVRGRVVGGMEGVFWRPGCWGWWLARAGAHTALELGSSSWRLPAPLDNSRSPIPYAHLWCCSWRVLPRAPVPVGPASGACGDFRGRHPHQHLRGARPRGPPQQRAGQAGRGELLAGWLAAHAVMFMLSCAVCVLLCGGLCSASRGFCAPVPPPLLPCSARCCI